MNLTFAVFVFFRKLTCHRIASRRTRHPRQNIQEPALTFHATNFYMKFSFAVCRKNPTFDTIMSNTNFDLPQTHYLNEIDFRCPRVLTLFDLPWDWFQKNPTSDKIISKTVFDLPCPPFSKSISIRCLCFLQKIDLLPEEFNIRHNHFQNQLWHSMHSSMHSCCKYVWPSLFSFS